MTRTLNMTVKITALAAVLVLAACGSAPPQQPRSDTPSWQESGARLTPEAGFDCSGLIGHVYKTRGGLQMPRTVARLQDAGQSVPAAQLRSGDLVIFRQRGEATHAGIYVGADRFVHAPSTGGEVRLDNLRSKYWAAQQVAYRRP